MTSSSLDKLGGRTAVLADVCLVALLAGGIGLGPRPGIPHLAVALGLILLSFIPWLSRSGSGGGLPWDHRLIVVAALVVLAGLRVDSHLGVAGWWALIPAGLLGLAGVVLALVSMRQGGWSENRFVLIGAVGVALVAAVGMGLLAKAVLALRSTAGMSPGRVDYFDELACYAAIWIGLDSRLRWVDGPRRTGSLGWCWRHRHGLAVGLSVGVSLLLLVAQ